MITILCSGSRGDLQPYIALAQQLNVHGFKVRITVNSEFESFVRDYGIECYSLKYGLSNVAVNPKLLDAASSSDNPFKMLLTFHKMKDYGIYMAEDMFTACEGSSLIIYHPGCTIGYFAAKQLGIPAVMASPFPLHKTKEHLSVIMYGKSKSTTMNLKLSYKVLQTMLWIASKQSIKKFWKKKTGHLPHDFHCPFEHVSKHYPALIACSNYVFSRPSDWNKHIHQYGYWFVEEQSEYIPSPELIEFLKHKDKPIYIGFGSMTCLQKHDDLLQIILLGLQKAGKRGVISGLHSTKKLPDTVFAINSIPHSWLFPKMAAVCHHGGAGTTAAGFCAGIPSIIVPFSNDQFAWAHRAYDLKVGAYPIYRKDFTADALAQNIAFALQNDIVQNAKELGKKIASEQGVKNAADTIISLLK